MELNDRPSPLNYDEVGIFQPPRRELPELPPADAYDPS
jgi:hypothetical protein